MTDRPDPSDPVPPLPPAGVGTVAVGLLRALLGPGRADAMPPTRHRLARLDAAHVDAYRRALGFAGTQLPITYAYLLAQRAELATLLAPRFPFRVAGMVHVGQSIDVDEPIGPDAAIELRCAMRIEPPAPGGAVQVAFEVELAQGAGGRIRCASRYLARRGARAAAAPRRADPAGPGAADAGRDRAFVVAPDAVPIDAWDVARDAGRRYARLSGDWNPIHLGRVPARALGLRAPIVHGMHTVGRAAAAIERRLGAPLASIDARFVAPVPLGARVSLVLAADGAWRADADGRPCAGGRCAPAGAAD